jgi:hypothetical protein
VQFRHSLKNRPDSLVKLEKTGTSDLAGLLSTQDRPANEPVKTSRAGRFSPEPANQAVVSEPAGSLPF